jgi:hypothetical protein
MEIDGEHVSHESNETALPLWPNSTNRFIRQCGDRTAGALEAASPCNSELANRSDGTQAVATVGSAAAFSNAGGRVTSPWAINVLAP